MSIPRRTREKRPGDEVRGGSLFDNDPEGSPSAARVRVEDAAPGTSPESALSIGLLTQTMKQVLEGSFTPLWIRGEVSNFTAHRNGHWYFTLKDADAQLRCVMWSANRRRVPAAPDDGMQVVALGQVTMYAARGDVQFSVTALDAVGDGLWRKAFEAARARLESDGLLDPALRRPLPRFPRRVTIITSADGAALHDIVSVVRRRAPAVELVLVPAAVQGDTAPDSLRRALARVAAWGPANTDVVIIGRGGGSREDLWAFNDEALARAVAAFPIPIISAVGHELDVTLCDLVADLRAATPSAAAEAAVPVWDDVRAHVRRLGDVLCARAAGRLRGATDSVARTARRLDAGATRIVDRRRLELSAAGGRLDALSPLATLRRGYAVARRESGATLRSVRDVADRDPIDVVVSDGTVHARVERVTPDTHAWPAIERPS